MKNFDLRRRFDRLTPVGICFRQHEFYPMLWGLVLAGGWSLGIPLRYSNAWNALFRLVGPNRERMLRPDAVMVPFSQLIQSGLWGFWLFLGAMAVLGMVHMLYHRRDSMSIYLMKRLPNPREYTLRCWAIPVLGSLAALALMGVLLGLYLLIYQIATPARCLR